MQLLIKQEGLIYAAFETRKTNLQMQLGIRALHIAGLSVTMPHKSNICTLLTVSESSKILEAVNCVVNDEGKLVGITRMGMVLDALSHDSGMDVADKKVLVVGAGGSARSIIYSLGKAGAGDVAVINRTKEKGFDAAKLAGPTGRHLEESELPAFAAEADLVINATPIGMSHTEEKQRFPIEPNLLSKGQLAVDLIYHPISTPWLEELKKRGVEAHGGLSMLIFQAARAFKLWTGQQAPLVAMRKAALKKIQ